MVLVRPFGTGSADAYRSTQRRRPNGLLTGACTIFFPSGERMKLIDPSKKISVNNPQVMAPVGRSRKKIVKKFQRNPRAIIIIIKYFFFHGSTFFHGSSLPGSVLCFFHHRGSPKIIHGSPLSS